ncbi:MAG: YraN family protein [Ignavibacteria bacterium]|nr:YraN family protein [Ignavibacteria bacterium]
MKCIYKNRLGNAGELIARNYLAGKNLKFIRNNYRFGRTEVDLIFEDEANNTLIFIEVKTRRNTKFGFPEESVTLNKQKNFRKTVMGFISENPAYSSHDLRIDVISILLYERNHEIRHIENAF